MRQVISFSLPQKMAKEIKSLSKKRGFSSVSSYLKSLIELDQDLISEKELLSLAEKARREYAASETVVADSMAELL